MKVRIAELWRYPIKSIAGHRVDALELDARGVVGDRQFAVVDQDGKFGSGKDTNRFRRMDGLLDVRWEGDELHFPDGTHAPRSDADAAFSRFLGHPVQVKEEGTVSHLDAQPVHLLTTASLSWLGAELGEHVEVERFRPNLLLEVEGTSPVEMGWVGRTLSFGDVRLEISHKTKRCRMIDLSQGDLPRNSRVLRTLGDLVQVQFGAYAQVQGQGEVRVGQVGELEE